MEIGEYDEVTGFFTIKNKYQQGKDSNDERSFLTSKEYNYYTISRRKKNSKIYWLDPCVKSYGEFLFTFDLKRVYNLFADYPHNLLPEEVKIFKKEETYWADFFKDRENED